MKAAPELQLRLLDLQALDSTLARLAARRASLPALAAIAAAAQEITRLEAVAVGHRTQVHDLARAQAKIDADVTTVRSRAERDQQRLDSGAVGATKELESLQSEIASLARRQAVLEDEELEIMEQRETAEGLLAETDTALDAQRHLLAGAEAERDAGFADIDAEAARVTADRASLAATFPADLLALYDKVRADRGGVGAAALTRRQCTGCHLQLAGSDLSVARDAPDDEVLRCDECRRILVRTAESGLR